MMLNPKGWTHRYWIALCESAKKSKARIERFYRGYLSACLINELLLCAGKNPV